MDVKNANKVTKSMIDAWGEKLDKNPSVKVVSEVILAFKAAISKIVNADEQIQDGTKAGKKPLKKKPSTFKVENGAMFNSLVKLCITKLDVAFAALLKVDVNKIKKVDIITKAKNWRPLNKWLKAYTVDLARLLSSMSEPSVVSALLKHINSLVTYYANLPKSAKMLVKTLVQIWSTHSEESVRVLAFMAILR